MAGRPQRYVVMLRGVNVGGTGTVSMTSLKRALSDAGFTDVVSYINSGNLIVSTDVGAKRAEEVIKAILIKKFKLDHVINKVLLLTKKQLQAVIKHKPKGFGEDTKTYYDDVIFLIGISAAQALPVFTPKEGVDTIWPGKGVVYSRRLGALRTKSRLNKIMSSPLYKSMTVRTWNTAVKLLQLMET